MANKLMQVRSLKVTKDGQRRAQGNGVGLTTTTVALQWGLGKRRGARRRKQRGTKMVEMMEAKDHQWRCNRPVKERRSEMREMLGSQCTVIQTQNRKSGWVDQGVERKVTQLKSRGTHRGNREREGGVSANTGTIGVEEDEDGTGDQRLGSSNGWVQMTEEDGATPVARMWWLEELLRGKTDDTGWPWT